MVSKSSVVWPCCFGPSSSIAHCSGVLMEKAAHLIRGCRERDGGRMRFPVPINKTLPR